MSEKQKELVLDNELEKFFEEGEKVKPRKLRKGYFFLENEKMLSKIKEYFTEGITVYQISDILMNIDKENWFKSEDTLKDDRKNSKYFNQAQTLQRQLMKIGIIKDKEEQKEDELKLKQERIKKLQEDINNLKEVEKKLLEEKKNLKNSVEELKNEISQSGLNS